MKRDYLIYSIVIGALLLTPSSVYDGRRGITGSGAQKYENKHPTKEGRFSRGIRKFYKKHEDRIDREILSSGDPTGVTKKLMEYWDRSKFKGRMPQRRIR